MMSETHISRQVTIIVKKKNVINVKQFSFPETTILVLFAWKARKDTNAFSAEYYAEIVPA